MLVTKPKRSSVNSFYYKGKVTNSVRQITMPSYIVEDDLAVLISFAARSGTSLNPSVDLTTGFTTRDYGDTPGTSNYNTSFRLSTKILDGTEAGNSINTFDTNGTNFWNALLIFGARDGISAITVGEEDGAADTGDTGQSIEYAAQNNTTPCIYIASGCTRSGDIISITSTAGNLLTTFGSSARYQAKIFFELDTIAAANTITSTISSSESNMLSIVGLELS